ncbi:hypothetical protein [Spirosoma rigui]|uniref:hypothetical protein n=1 Tax=Spirosoma rigui TaxID=564064 RepID=UPI0009B12FB0|nr:hypothetical protein [Spirosoma rigui]
MNDTIHSLRRPTLFVTLYVVLLGVECQISRSGTFQRQPDLMAGAILFDLVVVPAALFYWLVLKPRSRSGSFLLLAIVAFLRLALFILPDYPRPFALGWPALIALVELGTLALVVVRIRSLLGAYRKHRAFQDPMTALSSSLAAVVSPGIAAVFTSESQVIRFSLLSWWRLNSDIKADQYPVTTYRESGQTALMIALLAVCLIEACAMHFLLVRWNPTVAFLITATSLYGMLFLTADLVTTRYRPSYLTHESLHLRLGIWWRIVIARTAIEHVSPLTERPDKKTGLLNGMLLVAPNTLLTLREPVWAEGPYGIRREVRTIALFVDDRPSFVRQLATS